jgi:4,5:9,10-diseco-3-hydroxy-5,9,17-trioxoandrosta-1(10),2-diene-4-oate hydrolase
MVAQTVLETPKSFWAEIDGQRTHYLKIGAGPPLFLVHGLLGGSFCWRFNVAELSKRHTVYALDLPGQGLSDVKRGTNCGMQKQAERLACFIQKEALDSVDVVASSWGGAVTLLLAASCSVVRSLVLAAPVNPWSTFGRERVRFCGSTVGSMLVRCGLSFSARFHHIAVERMYGDTSRIQPGTIEGYSELIRRRGRARSLINIFRNWEHDLAALEGAIPCVEAPTLLVWGTRDGAVDLRSAEPLKRSLRHCRVQMLPGVGHLPFEESPEVFNRLVLDFIEHPE